MCQILFVKNFKYNLLKSYSLEVKYTVLYMSLLQCNKFNHINTKGETGAGKSSFINLLLETNLLPTSQLACTSTFCELHKSRDNRKVATLYYKALEGPGSERSPVKIDIGTEERLKQLAVEISRIDETTDESPYERIVIQYPFPLLEVEFWGEKWMLIEMNWLLPNCQRNTELIINFWGKAKNHIDYMSQLNFRYE